MKIHPLLGVRTDLSLGESIISIDDLEAAATKAGAEVIGVCDTMSITSLIDGTKKAAKLNKQFLIGVRIRVIDQAVDAEGNKVKECDEHFIKLFPVNDEGIRSIYRLLTRGFTEDRFYYYARVTWDDIIECVAHDCCAFTTGDTESAVNTSGGLAGILKVCAAVRFVARFYELAPCSTPYFSRQNRRASKLKPAGFEPLVSTPTLWLEPGQSTAYSVIASIMSRNTHQDFLRPATEHHPFTAAGLATKCIAAATAIEQRYGENLKAEFLKGLENTDKLV
jgi:DNA polymerase III alpha subunit